MEIAVLDINGKETGRTVDLPDSVFAIEPNDHAIYLDVKQIRANKRQGTHAAKERADIVGSTKKLKKQKGTGTARAGSIKSPVFRGGGRAFGPRPRNYGFKMNKKVKRLAKRSALSHKAAASEIAVIESFSFEKPRTKEYIQILRNLELEGKKTLLVLSEKNDNIYLSSRNIPETKVLNIDSLNTYDILDAEKLIFVEPKEDAFAKY